MPVYHLNGKSYNIPDNVVAQFEKDNPNATVNYQANGKTYGIPVSERDGFLQKYPDAVLEGKPQKKQSTPQQQPVATPQSQPSAQTVAQQQGLQQAQIPHGFGQFNIQQANQMGAGRGPVSWEQPEPKQETVVDKTVRMMQGKATPQEQKQVQSRMQQRKDEIAYKEETGKDLRQPVLNTEFEAPTVSRDEDGNILIGNTTDQDRASAHQQVMAEQAAWDSLSDKEKQEKMKQMQLEMEQNEYEEPGFLGVTGKKLGSGFIKAGLGLLNGMKALASGMIVEDASSPTGYSKTEDYDPTKNNDAINRGLEAANQYAERMSREGEPRKGAGFTDLLLDGDIGGFLLKGWGSALESAPMTLSIYNPYTMALNAISMAGNNFRENTIENPDIPAWKRASMAIGSAAIEQAVEKFSDPVFKYFNGGRILSWFGKKASEESTKKITKEAESILARRIMGVIKDAAAEGAEEVVTNFGNDALGQALDWMDGEAEYGIVAQWKDYKKLHPNADLAGFAMQKAKENLDSFFGGALGGAYMSGSAQITAAGYEYATGHTVSPEQMANPTAPIHPATLDIAQSYDEGYTMDNEQDVANAKANYEAQRQRATEILGETKGLDENPTQTLQTMQDGLQDGSFTPEQVQAALDYVDAKATVDGIQQRIVEDNRSNRHNFVANGNNIDEIDAQGNVVATHEYENADEMRTALWEMQAKREHDDVMTDINIAKTNPKYDYDGIIGAFAEETGLDVDYIESILNKDPLELEDPESAMVAEFAEILHNTIYDNTEVHEEQSAQDGANLADEMGIDLNNLSPAQVEQAQQITADFSAAQQALNQAFAADENLQQEVERLEKVEKMPKQGIVSTLGELGFRPNQVQAVIDYYNAEAKYKGFVLQMSNKIDEAAANERQRHTMKGTIDGVADLNNIHTISDGTNEYYLVSGNITTDSDGRITGSDSGLIIGMDLDGSFVNISDTDGYSVMPVTETLDQWEEAERTRLEEEWSAKIDPTGAMMQQPAEEQSGNVDNAGGEASAENGTGANEPSATAPNNAIGQPPLTEDMADQLLASMEANAVQDPEISLTQEAWTHTFGINNSMRTPVGNVKMGEHQYQKLVDKNRSTEFGMVVQTLQDPDVVLVEPSLAAEGQETERPYSLVFVKTFVRNGQKIKYYASVTVQRDNMEVSISSHFMNPNRVKERLTTLNRIYTKQALIPNSSEWHLAEQQYAVPDLLPTQGNNASSGGKVTENAETKQEISVKVDKNGIKLYEEGTPIDDAIADIIADGFDVNEIADASIAEAQAIVDKINGKANKTRKDLVDRKKAQDTITYYNNIKARWAEVQQAELPSESEENVNVQPEQPIVEEKTVSSQQETGMSEKPTNLTVEEQKKQRIAEAKAKYGELFDDDFTKANDVYELVSMWVGRKRNLAWDDVNGKRGLQKELGWKRKIGGDTKYIETLLAKNGDGAGVDEFVHMVWESPENDVNGEKRFSTEEIKEALLDLLKSAQSKSDVVDYALNTRIAQAETALQEQQKQAAEETEHQTEIEPLTDEEIQAMEANLPFARPVEGEDIPDSPITQLMKAVEELRQQEGMPEIKLVDTDRMSDDEWYDIASAMFDGAFVSQEEIDFVRDSVLREGLYIIEESGAITVYSDSQTAEELKYKVEYIKEQKDGRSNEEETGGLEAENVQRPEEGVHGVQSQETPAAEGTNGTESQGSSESVTDEYLQPRNAEEEAIIQGVVNQLQQEIQTAVEDVDKARTDLEKARAKESDRATDMFANDETFAEPDAIFSQEEMGLDTSAEGVERRTAAQREKLQEATNKLNQLQSLKERNSRIRGALDNYRRQTEIEEPATDVTGTVADPMEAIEQAAQQFKQEQEEKKAYGADNKLISQDRYEELKKRMKQKLLGQANMGFDPEIMQIGAEMAMFHIEAGARKFADYATRMINDLGDAIRPYLQGFYEAARRMPGMEQLRKEMDSTEFVDNFDVLSYDKQNDNTVNVNKQENNEPENSVSLQQEAAKPAEELEGDSAEFADRQGKIADIRTEIFGYLQEAIQTGDIYLKTMQSVKTLAKKYGLDDMSMTDLQELVEAEVVNLARRISNDKKLTDEQKFENIKRLYEFQPSLNARDNDRINKQQYSTPAPMAYLMGMFVDPQHKAQSGLEPSAGNGMLTIALPKEIMHVNDIDEMRLSNLQKQGFGQVTSQDGTQPFDGKYDVVVTNPPFGSVTPKVYDGIYEISALEHQMAINALESMKDDGRAAIIIGGNTEYKTNGAVQGKDRIFLNYLYSHYNVVDVINMDGKTLYSRQGTGYPVRMILINGRKEFDPQSYAPVKSKARAEQVKSYDELYKRVNDDILRDKEYNGNTSVSVHTAESGQNDGLSDNGNVSPSNEKGVRNVRTTGSSGEHQLPTEPVASVQRSDASAEAERGRGNAQPESDGGVGTRPVLLHGRGNQSEQSGGSQAVPSGNGTGEVAVGGSNTQRLSGNSVDSRAGLSVEQPEQKRELGAEKVPYRKQSTNPFDLQSQMPAEQADVVKKALEDIGDVDQFLVDELGYSSIQELHQALAAEQIDSVALAIHQMKNGDAFIIGDQTGIGKGRQGAALIRWAVKNGKAPVYFTAKPELFSSVYRDIKDIHSDGLRPFILASDKVKARITERKDGKDEVLFDLPTDKEQKRVLDYINKNGKLPQEYDFMITTYSQVGNGTMEYENGNKRDRKYGKGKSATKADVNGQKKRDAIENLAGNSIVLMDESHLAGGESARGNYLQYVSTKAGGITYISATFAKRPDNMPLYSLRTAISKAGVEVGELIEAVKRGGATFQEIMSKALTEAGQMIRRERNMTGVTVDWKGIEDEDVIKKHYEQYDKIIGLFNDIIGFQRTYVDPIIDKMNDDAAEMQGEVDHTPGTRDMGINNTPFASQTHQIVKKVLLSLKAEEGAKFAVECLKNGEKPVICVENTNEGAADRATANSDEDMVMPDLSTSLQEGLEGTLRIKKTDSNGNDTYTSIPVNKLSEEGQRRYHEIEEAIAKSSTGLSLSPIDVIKNYIKKAGYSIAELTGRKKEFVFNEDGTVKRLNRTDTDNKKNASDFNSGIIDAVIMNKSAGTGIDLHAGIKFLNTDQRHMIVVQPQSDINDEVQMRGRTDRTGQKQHSRYTYIVSTIPSEQRLLMMLKAKLRSLDANTTSSQKSKFNEMKVQDIINKYGDDVVIQYLSEHVDLAEMLLNPLKWTDDWQVKPSEQLVAEAQKANGDGETAKKVLGRMALLKVAEQEKMLSEISAMYQAEIDRLNEMGENDLEITEMPLKAKTLSKQVWEQGVDPNGKNPFADNTYVEKVNMDVLKKPMKASEVKASQERLLGGKTWEEFKQSVMEKVDAWAEQKKADTTETITERAKKKAAAEQERYVKGAKKAQEKNQMTDEEIERNGQHQYDTFYKQEMDKLNDALAAIEAQKQVFVDALETFNTNDVYALPSNIYDLQGMTFEPGVGKLIDIKITDNMSPNASTLSFATLDGRRKITIPINGKVKQQKGEKAQIYPTITSLTAQAKSGWFGQNVANTMKVLAQSLDNWDKLTSSAARKDGYIITGNLLKALVSTREQGVGGKLISYTTDTGEVRQGILMPDNFEPAGLTSKTPISAKKDELKYNRDKVTSADGDVTVQVTNDWDWNTRGYNTLELVVPKSSKRGGKYFNDETLLSLMDGQFEGSSKMKAEFPRTNLDAVMKRLDELGVTVTEEHEDNSPRRMITTSDPLEAIQQAAESWIGEHVITPRHFENLVKKHGLNGAAPTLVISSEDDMKGLPKEILEHIARVHPDEDMDFVQDMVEEDLNTIEYLRKDRRCGAAYLPFDDYVVVFADRFDSKKDAEAAWWHEQTHHFYHSLPKAEREQYANACKEYLIRERPGVYLHIMSKYREAVRLEESCAYFIGDLLEGVGTEKFLDESFEFPEIINNFANELLKYIKNGKQERSPELRQEGEEGQRPEVYGGDNQRRERQGTGLRSDDESGIGGLTDPIEAIERSARKWIGSRRDDEDRVEGIKEINEYSAKQVYHDRIDRAECVITESGQDDMVTFKNGQNAIAHDEEIPDSQNAYQAMNLSYGKTFNEQEQFTSVYRTPLEATVFEVMKKMGWKNGDVDRYLFTKHGFERNRVLYVRDWLNKMRSKELTQEEKDRLDNIEQEFVDLQNDNYQDLQKGDITFVQYIEQMDDFIKSNINRKYDAEKHDYSGFTEMFGDDEGKYSEKDILAELEEQESKMGKDLLDKMWKQINLCSQLGLDKYRDTGMISDSTYSRIKNMFHWYVPMRGYSEGDAAQDHWQYMTVADGAGRIGGLLKNAKGRKSKANYPLATLFAMTYKAISDANQNVVKQHFYRLCQAHPNDLVTILDTWAVLDPTTGEFVLDYPKIDSDMTSEEVEQATADFYNRMKELEASGEAKRLKGTAKFDYKVDKQRMREHIVEVRINGQRKMMIVKGNPRMAQAINGELRYESGKGKLNQMVASTKQYMQSISTSYNLTFLGRNMLRDWTHFGAILAVREGMGYESEAKKYYRQQLPHMISLFKKYRNGTLDESNEMERDFKDFMDNGGITGFVMMNKLDKIQKEMESTLSEKGKVKRIGNSFIDNTLGAVEAMNEAIENNARFATYRASRHYAGRTKARSAYDAKEVTVNFNKKGAGKKTAGFKSDKASVKSAATIMGEVSQILMANKMFFNATVQAICNIFRGVRNPDGSINKKYVARLLEMYATPPFVMGMMMPVINGLLYGLVGGDDGDDPYANLPEWVRRKNLCVYIGWVPGFGKDDFLTIPMGQELAAFYSMGDMLAGYTLFPSLKPVDKSIFDEVVGFLNVFSPVDFENKVSNENAPVAEFVGRVCSPLAPMVAIGENIGWTGRPIYRRDKYPGDEYSPEYQMTLGNTNSAYVALSKWLNDVSGGDDVKRGWIQVNPGAMQYLFEQYTGGPGKFFMNTGSAIGDAYKWTFTDDEPDFNIRKIELAKALIQQGDERTELYRVKAKYRKYRDEANEKYHNIKGYERDADSNPEHYMKLLDETRGAGYQRMMMVREAEKTLKQLNTAANQLEGRERKNARALYNTVLAGVVSELDKVQDIPEISGE